MKDSLGDRLNARLVQSFLHGIIASSCSDFLRQIMLVDQ